MILKIPQTNKFLFVTWALFCLTNFAFAGKLLESQTKVSRTGEPAALQEVSAAAAIKGIENNSTENEDLDKYSDGTIDRENAPAEKNAVQTSADTSLNVWGIVSGLWNWIREDISESLFGDDAKTSAVGEGRTFGKIRRMQMALIPIVFKFGVLSAMIAFLVGLGIKTLVLLKILIVMNLLTLLAKFFTFKNHFGHGEHYSAGPAPIWNPYVTSGWQSTPAENHSNKEIHLHIHGGQFQPQVPGYAYGSAATGPSRGWERRNDPYGAYETVELQGQQSDELTNTLNSITGSAQRFPQNPHTL